VSTDCGGDEMLGERDSMCVGFFFLVHFWLGLFACCIGASQIALIIEIVYLLIGLYVSLPNAFSSKL